MNIDNSNSAIVLFSGGQDSTTCLAWALNKFDSVETIAFNYKQRHSVELDCRLNVLEAMRGNFLDWSKKLGEDHLLDIPVLSDISDTSLTSLSEIIYRENGLPSTFVPGRNLLFLVLTAALAYRRGIKHIVTGVCETDYSGYPDCRNETIKAQEKALSLGLDFKVEIHTPLMWIDKAQTWDLAYELGGNDLINIICRDSHTCYLGDRSLKSDWGYGCGKCPACEIRMLGWQQFLSLGKYVLS
jgi:7-cyano-7-deazaguanine synthase